MTYLAIAIVLLYLIPTCFYAMFFDEGSKPWIVQLLIGLTWPYALLTLVRARLILNSKDDHEH